MSNTPTLNPARIPITNAIVGGDYTGTIELGPSRTPANVILDTGSSTLAVWKNKFGSTPVSLTNYVQFVAYGTGSWAGPVVQAQVGMGTGQDYIDLPAAMTAQIQSGEYNGQPQFYPADGILGLAYASLNQAANVGPNYPLANYDTPSAWQWLISQLQLTDIDPWFQGLVDVQEVMNKFAFLTRRSFVDYSTSNPASDPANQGWFILGGGEEQQDLYTGQFQSVAVVDDEYYNTNLMEIQVGTQPPIPVSAASNPQLPNSIVDSGTNSLSIDPNLFNQILWNFGQINSDFYNTLMAGTQGSVSLTAQDLTSWPSIFFTLQGTGGANVTLEVKPTNYWQLNATPGHQAILAMGPGDPGMSILGLPLMNGYYVVFDRSMGSQGLGEIKFATPAS